MGNGGFPALAELIARAKDDIRRSPELASHRIAYFQFLCLAGDWERAADQLELAEKLDTANVLFSQAYGRALRCEAERKRVHTGDDDPIILGEPAEWLGLLIEAFRHARGQDWEAASKAQAQAFQAAPETPGKIDGTEFGWLSDTDSRYGPVLEAFVEGHYRWIPFSHFNRIEIHAPEHWIDLVWLPAKFEWSNEGESNGLIPTRYFGTELSSDEILRQARSLECKECAPNYFVGTGVREFCWESGELAITQAREIVFDTGRGPPEN